MIWFLYLYFITLLVGMSPMEAAAALLSLATLYGFWQQKNQGKKFPFFWTGFEWSFTIWIVLIFLSFAANNIWDNSFLVKLAEFKWMIFIYFLIYALMRTRLNEKVLPWVVLPVVLASGYAVALSVFGYDPLKQENLELVAAGGFARSGGLYSHAMTMAHSYTLILCWFFGLTLVYVRYLDRKMWWPLVASLLLGLAVLTTFTRGAWIAAMAAFIGMSFTLSLRFGILFTFLSAICSYLLYELWPSFQNRIDLTYSNLGYDAERIWIWKANWEIFKDHPFFGVGYGNNPDVMKEYLPKIGAPDYTIISHAHNQYLHFLSGTGVFGLLIYLLVLFLFLRLSFLTLRVISYRDLFSRGLCLGLIGAQIACLFGGLTEANFEHSKFKYVLVLTWALVVWQAYEFRVLREKV